MEKHTLIYTALPNGRAEDGSLRLSVFIAPRLWSDDAALAKLKLAQFPEFLDWPARVAGAAWEVAFDGGPTLPATVESPAPRADLWSALFQNDTEVRPFRFDDYRGATIQTFSSAKIHDFLAGIYVRAASDPAFGLGSDLPKIELLAGDPEIAGIARPSRPEPPFVAAEQPPVNLGGTLPRPGPTSEPPPRGGGRGCGCAGCLFLPLALLARLFPFLQSFIERLLGSAAGSGSGANAGAPILPSDPKPVLPPDAAPISAAKPPPPGPAAPAVAPSPAKAAFDQLREFTEASLDSVKLPEIAELQERYDFHEMIAALGDYPVLLRLFGLVVDLRVPLNGAAPAGESLVRVAPATALTTSGTAVVPRTHYELTATTFAARSRPGDSEISHGFLRLNDASRFRVIQLDALGGGIKMQNAATNIAAFPDDQHRAPNMPTAAGLPSLRTGGLSVVRLDPVAELRMQFLRSHALQQMVAAIDSAPQPPVPPDAEPPLVPNDELFAEDLVRGYRVDVFDSKSHKWHSLCQRRGIYNFLDAPGALPGEIADEGFVQFGATEPAGPAAAKRTLRVGDSLFVWDGWSLAAPRPSDVIMPQKKGEPLHNVTLARPGSGAVTKFRLEANFRAEPRSLPRLRFDYSYRLRARVCDLAGNSVIAPTLADGTANPAFNDDVAEQTADFPCARFEPVNPPAMMLRALPVEGESLERMVVRSGAVLPGSDTTERHMIPPKISQLTAEQHGKFDGVQLDGSSVGYLLATREEGALDDPPATNAKDIWFYPNQTFLLTYLPDPAARGALLLGLPGVTGADTIIEPTGPTVVNKIPFSGSWPDRLPFRIRLVAIGAGAVPDLPKWDAGERLLTVQLPKAQKAVVRISSYLHGDDLERQGVWQWTKEAAPPTFAEVQARTVAGRSWLHLPWRELTLVHAVTQPLGEPAVLTATAEKKLGQTFAKISGTVSAEIASTGKVDLHGTWTDPIDDPELDKMGVFPPATTQTRRAHLCELMVAESDVTPLLIRDGAAGTEPLHNFGDTKHHVVTYEPIATTRFREYFPASITDDLAKVTLGGPPSAPVMILNSARPAAPKVLYIVPVYGWEEKSLGAGKFQRTRHGGGLRVYLERPWFSSGAGELLGVVFLPDAQFTDLDQRTKAVVTQWGADPVWLSSGAPAAAAEMKHFHDQVAKADDLTLSEIEAKVSVAAYDVQFDVKRKLWFADITVDAGTTYAPFVRLALARFQPDSVADAHLSRVVRADFAQLAPNRTASITRSADQAHIHVAGPSYLASSVTAAAGQRRLFGKDSGRIGRAEIEALLQERDPALGADPHLGWKTLSTTLLTQEETSLGEWKGAVDLTAAAGAGEFRILLQEYEWYRSDFGGEGDLESASVARRIVYAEAMVL